MSGSWTWSLLASQKILKCPGQKNPRDIKRNNFTKYFKIFSTKISIYTENGKYPKKFCEIFIIPFMSRVFFSFCLDFLNFLVYCASSWVQILPLVCFQIKSVSIAIPTTRPLMMRIMIRIKLGLNWVIFQRFRWISITSKSVNKMLIGCHQRFFTS